MNGNATKVLQALGLCLGRASNAGLIEATGLTRYQLNDVLKTLKTRGLSRSPERGLHAITPAGKALLQESLPVRSGPIGPRPVGSDLPHAFRSRLWRALRLTRKGSIADLLVLAARDQDKNPAENAKGYLNTLARIGIVTRMARKDGPHTRYLLVKDLGPLAPRWDKRASRVFDPNSQEIFDVA